MVMVLIVTEPPPQKKKTSVRALHAQKCMQCTKLLDFTSATASEISCSKTGV